MITVRLFTKEKMKSFLRKAYPAGNAEKSFSGTDAADIISFFEDVQSDEWQVIDFRGKTEEIADYLSLLSSRFFTTYFLVLSLPVNGNVEMATIIHQKVEVGNLCKTSNPMFSMKLDENMNDEKIAFQLIAPKYSYTEMWEQQNGR